MLDPAETIIASNDLFKSIDLTYQQRNGLILDTMQFALVPVAAVSFVGVGVAIRGDNPTG